MMKHTFFSLIVTCALSIQLNAQTPFDSFAPEATRPMLEFEESTNTTSDSILCALVADVQNQMLLLVDISTATIVAATPITDDIRKWLSVDPLVDNYPDISPYAYCHWGPINRIDPNGRADYYDIDGNHLCNDGVEDKRVFQQNINGDVVLGGYATPFSYVGDVDKISLLYEGAMVDGKNQSAGDLIVSQHVGDKVFNQKFSAVSGNSNAYTLQNGVYSCSSFRYRSSSEGKGGYYNNGYGFSINLNPSFTTMRTDLRIHPDGGKQGTLGCIGLSGGASELQQFVRTMTPFVPADSKNTSVLLTVVVTGNPDCFKAADKTGPALFK